MKKFLATIIALLGLTSTMSAADITKGCKTFGVRTGYATLNRAPLAGIEFSYAFNRHFILAPSIDYVFRNDNLDGLLFNIDYHGPWQLTPSGRVYLYHILGINYASWSRHEPTTTSETERDATTDSDDVTTRTNRLGVDVGAGVAFYVTPTLRLSLQGKFNWVKDHNAGIFNLGISYAF